MIQKQPIRVKRSWKTIARVGKAELFEKVEYYILQIVVFVFLITSLVKLLSEELRPLRTLINSDNLRPLIPYLAKGTGAAGVLFALMSFFVYLLKKKTATSNPLKLTVVNAFVRALEESSFRPHGIGKSICLTR